MYPTMFRLPFLPDWLADIKSYGVMMMIAFLTGIWLACRRAYKTQADPDVVINLGFIALILGVIGARAMFVIHYWETRFANQPNPLWAVFDIRAGGLEFWGGPLLVIPAIAIYLRYIAKVSARWYLDITIPSLAWGLAITRIGCFLNGCCWGAVCVQEHDSAHDHAHAQASIPWAVTFPYGSAAMHQQYKFGQLVIPKELIHVLPTGESRPYSREYLDAWKGEAGETYRQLQKEHAQAAADYDKSMQAGADAAALERHKSEIERTKAAFTQYTRKSSKGIAVAMLAQQSLAYGLTPDEFIQLAGSYRSKPVHPAQLYATINGLILCGVLTLMFYYRRRHGILVGWFLILYSISRVFLELIRQDNPLDTLGLTISQGISAVTFLIGVLCLLYVHTRMPLVSPRRAIFVLPEEEAPPEKKKPRKRK